MPVPMTELVLLAMKFVALVLVGWRLGWLLIEDSLTEPLRVRVIDWAGQHHWPKLQLFVQCPFCLGFWVEVALVAVMAQITSLPYPVLWPLALNALTAPLHHLADRATRDEGD